MLSFSSIPLLHVGGAEPVGPWFTHWVLDPRIAVFIFGITALYLAWIGPLNRRRSGADERQTTRGEVACFLIGSAVALIALGPPLDDWSDYFLVSAHMAQHLLLMLVVAPLWLLGIPAWVFEPLTRNPTTRRIGDVLTHWLVCAIVPAAAVVIWHVPIMYDAALNHPLIHALEHQIFIAAAFFLWWPLVSKVPAWPRLSPLLQCLHLFAQTIPGGVVGAFLAYSAAGLYKPYLQATVRPWGLPLKTDQEIAGVLMWVGGNMFFLLLISIIFLRWATREEAKDRQRAVPQRQESVAPF